MQLLTTAGWAGVIADLQSKQQAAREHAEQLQAQKRALALESAMGSPEAKKQLTKINGELTRMALEGEDWTAALSQAEASRQLAEQTEKDAAERERQAELSALAATVINHASAALQQAVKAGAALKLVIQNMINRANTSEQPNLDRILQRSCYMRAAQFAGLQSFVEFQGYPGPKDQVVALETEIGVYLGKWLNNNGKKG